MLRRAMILLENLVHPEEFRKCVVYAIALKALFEVTRILFLLSQLYSVGIDAAFTLRPLLTRGSNFEFSLL